MARSRSGMPPAGAARLSANAAVLAWLGFHVFLSADVLVRILGVRSQLERPIDGFTLIAIEGSHAIALSVALLVAATAVRPAIRIRQAGLFALLVASLAAWFARAFAFPAYPGHVQEWIARRLMAAGTPLGLLDFVFAAPEWPLWLALGAFLRLAVTWPRPAGPASIAESGASDRRGMMRSTAIAGADIGAAFRAFAASSLSHGLLESRIVWPAVVTGGIAHTLVAGTPVGIVLTVALLAGLALSITFVRAAFRTARSIERRRILWTATAAVVAGSGFLVAATLSTGHDTGSGLLGMVVACLTPILAFMAMLPVTLSQPPAAMRRLRLALFTGACAWTGAIAYLLSMATLPGAPSPELPVRELIALATSTVLVAFTTPRLRQVTDRLLPPAPG